MKQKKRQRQRQQDKPRALPLPHKAAKSPSRRSGRDDLWNLPSEYREKTPAPPETGRQQVSFLPEEQIGPEYWLG